MSLLCTQLSSLIRYNTLKQSYYTKLRRFFKVAKQATHSVVFTFDTSKLIALCIKHTHEGNSHISTVFNTIVIIMYIIALILNKQFHTDINIIE